MVPSIGWHPSPHIPTTAVQWRLELQHCNDLQGILFSWTSFVFAHFCDFFLHWKLQSKCWIFSDSILSNQLFPISSVLSYLHSISFYITEISGSSQMLYFNPFTKYSCCSLDSLHFFCLTHCLAFDFWDRRTFCNSCIQDFCNAQLRRWNNTIWKPGLSSVWLYLCFLYFHSQLLTAQNGSQVRPGCVCVFVLLYLYICIFVNVITVQLRPSREMAQIGSQV